MKVIGIDPGSIYTAYGILEKGEFAASGLLKLGKGSVPSRLKTIFSSLSAIIAEHRIEEVIIEGVFLGKNVDSAMKLGQARAAVILAAEMQGLPIYEYSPREIKLSVVGHGGAEKQQVAYMVNRLLNLKTIRSEHETDALACAICHIHSGRIPEIKNSKRL